MVCVFLGFLELLAKLSWPACMGEAGSSRTPGSVDSATVRAGLNGEACTHEGASPDISLCLGLPRAAPMPFLLGRSLPPPASPLIVVCVGDGVWDCGHPGVCGHVCLRPVTWPLGGLLWKAWASGAPPQWERAQSSPQQTQAGPET